MHKIDKEYEDLIVQYEYNIKFLTLIQKLLKRELTDDEALDLKNRIESITRKGILRYYRDKKEYRKEEIMDLGKELMYGTFLKYCPFNIDCYVYEIIKRKLGNKKR